MAIPHCLSNRKYETLKFNHIIIIINISIIPSILNLIFLTQNRETYYDYTFMVHY